MWQSIGVNTTCQIFSCLSSLSFFIVPFAGVPGDIPGRLVFVQCCMVQIGIGTIIFHSGIPENPVYVIMDYYPMILIGAALMYLYVSCEFRIKHSSRVDQFFFESSFGMFIFFFLLTSWALLLLYLLDDEVMHILQRAFPDSQYISYYNTINIVLALPMVVVFLCYSFSRFTFAVYWKAWLFLLLAMACYFVNYLGCPHSYWLAIFHGVYHVLMSLALWYIACMAITIDTDWKLNWFVLSKVESNSLKALVTSLRYER